MFWLIERKSQLNVENKHLLYKSILKPVWTYMEYNYGAWQVIPTSKFSNVFCIVDAPWFVLNFVIQRDLHMSCVKEKIKKHSVKYGDRLSAHRNQ